MKFTKLFIFKRDPSDKRKVMHVKDCSRNNMKKMIDNDVKPFLNIITEVLLRLRINDGMMYINIVQKYDSIKTFEYNLFQISS